MTRSGRVVGHRILRTALLPSHVIPCTDLRPSLGRGSPFVDERGAWIGGHAGGADQMSVALPEHLCDTGGLHNLHGFILRGLNELLVIVVKMEFT